MDENKKYHNPDDDGINNESDNDTYDPYEEYVKDKVHEEQNEEYGDSYARYTDPQMGPEDDSVLTNHITDVLLILRRLASQ